MRRRTLFDEHLVFAVNNPESGSLVFRFSLLEGSNDWWWAIDNVTIQGAIVPEPSSFVLGAMAVLGLLVVARRRR
ncbi:MAG: PEP-CTERM sorting domain-containing protein [Planctomycetaceae bacterium]|nr:PEP-CTERM sorting domain-containing protein [Planctomycetaceae bacterium]